MHRGLLILILTLSVLACSRLERVRQVRTVADMQTISAKIEALREREPTAVGNRDKVRSVILSVADGRDGWGHELLYFSRRAGSKFSYVLVSTGSDGKLDVADPQEYFTMEERINHDEPWRDIVFRDGHAITRAGK